MNPNNQDEQLRQDIIKLITDNTNLSQQNAEKALDKWQETYDAAADKINQKTESLKNNVKEAAESGADAIGGVTFSAFLAMLLGLIATILGSCLGARYRKKHLS
jgi:hypothetical protein